MDRTALYPSQSPTNASSTAFNPSIVISPTENSDDDPRSKDVDGDGESFRDSTQLIPSPKQRPPQWTPMVLEYWAIATMVMINLGLAIALEVGIYLSNKNNGFQVAKENIFDPIRPQLLLSFFPTLLVLPVTWLWRDMEWSIRWLHPYVVLSKGQAPANQSLLMDYIALGPVLSMGKSARFKHWIVFAAIVTGLSTFLFQPLAGSIFRLEGHPEKSDYEARTLTQIGLLEEEQLDSLNAFVAAAGFTQAAAYNNLTDPPFIRGDWTAAQFALPDWFTVNGSIILNTSGVRSNPNCAIPRVPPTLTPNPNSTTTLSATSSTEERCNASATFNPSDSEEQFGVVEVPCDDTPTDFQRVMFWFYRADGNGQAQAVFCHPSIQLLDVELTVNVTTNVISNVKPRGDRMTPNTVTERLGGRAYNGVVFDTTGRSSVVRARADAIRSGIPGTIYRLAGLQDQGIDAVFRDTNGFLRLTEEIYTRHLSVAGKSIYFTPVSRSSTLRATLESTVSRLVIDNISGHILAFLMAAIAISGLIIHIKHRRLRRTLYLASPPGNMANVISMASRAGFGELLLPYDTEEVLKRKLDGLRFRMDGRTGAIVVDEAGMERVPASAGGRMAGRMGGGSEATMGLRGEDKQEGYYSSSRQARESATALSEVYPPSVPYRTPYDVER